ncbi:phosphoglucomutase [Limosilactobacillus reuteri]|uniref:Phosphoglucomutase n=1 Tax=Limosilactobacillus reuteri TaxID=1598 RepID=A0A256VE87_LIMRT|nr:phospho-sugar mutase [Limosilactobacillus reuteri]MCC4368584.1 phospho-sugar mutase [Limosilactobacillus reuteri]OYS69674.1 phosphoglucomutase [Limosilactobacillus reuteri]OYS85833.1 phosphoglucomutase [Limosilactobacillus reuteri]OYS87453.1 phosphoglucomutase [Limosilactobacillus reuteri]OYS95933.1 phosphoglucomutase [Limosilactobacillus reuteri]
MSWKDTYKVWQERTDLEPDLKQELAAMNDDKEIEDAFYGPLSFGTAGMRGLMGPGINRMNVYTVRQATEGLATLMDSLGDDIKKRGVAIGYDSRHNSRKFAHDAARVLGAHGIKVYIYDNLRPTPELSFAVRHMRTYAGIMITASHNPKEYNGYKIYGEDGGQMPPKESDMMTGYIRKIDDIFDIALADEQEMLDNGLETIMGEDVDAAYLANAKGVTVNPELAKEYGKDMKFVFTPLCGTGRMLGERALRQAGFTNYEMEPTEAQPNGDFPGLEHPNPEFPEAFVRSIALGKKVGADVLIATDPDADRLGCAVRQPDGEYQLLTGNQIASIMLAYILEAHKQAGTLPKNAAAVKSIVSTNFAAKIAESYGVDMINVLTGFKWIADQIHQYETGKADHTFMFGFEESYGYLIKPFVRDKDAIQSLTLLAEVAAYYRSRNMTLYDGLQELFKKYGYFREKTIANTYAGVDGPAKIKALMKKFREEAPTHFAGHQVVVTEDFANGTKTTADGKVSELGIPESNVLRYILDDDTWIAIRPSGTEPKLKFYIGTSADTLDKANEKLANFEKALQEFAEE